MPSESVATRARLPGALGGAGLLSALVLALLTGMRVGDGPATAPVPITSSSTPRDLVASSEAEAASPLETEPAVPPTPPTPPTSATRWFDSRPVVPLRTLTMQVTAYSPDERSCAPFADGVTASGYSVWTNGMAMVAADTSILPFGAMLTVPGYADDAVVPVLDRGAAITGMRLDVLFPTHEAARAWGVRDLEVTVWGYADGRPDGFVSGW
jgi:3D (Asp-Asp-Asp) domain-containing protein